MNENAVANQVNGDADRQRVTAEAALELKRRIYEYLSGGKNATGNAFLEMVAESAAQAMVSAMEDVVVEYIRRNQDPSAIVSLLKEYSEQVAEYYRESVRWALDEMSKNDFEVLRRAYGSTHEAGATR